MSVVGIDACPSGWVGIVAGADGQLAAVWAKTIDELTTQVDDLALVAIDIPIGLPETGVRACDREAREFLGNRRSAVFFTPIRDVLEAATFEEANTVSRAMTGGGVSRQSYGLRAKLLQVDAWLHTTDLDVREVHPEVSFTAMAGRALHASKKTWAGFAERRTLLETVGFVIADDLGEAGRRAGYDDVLDAAAAAWTALRIAAGEATTLPATREVDERTGRSIAIWA